jgi:hypothetical protein
VFLFFLFILFSISREGVPPFTATVVIRLSPFVVVVVVFLLFLRRFVFNPRDTVEPDGWTAQSGHTYPDEDVSPPPLSPLWEGYNFVMTGLNSFNTLLKYT